MKRFTFLLMMPLLLLPGIATGQSERTFVKSFNLMGRQTAVVNLGDNIQVTYWDNDLVRVQMTVKVATVNDATLKAIAESARYTLKSDLTVQHLVITAPNLNATIKINGNELKETITYQVFLPKNIAVLKNTDPNGKIVAKLNP